MVITKHYHRSSVHFTCRLASLRCSLHPFVVRCSLHCSNQIYRLSPVPTLVRLFSSSSAPLWFAFRSSTSLFAFRFSPSRSSPTLLFQFNPSPGENVFQLRFDFCSSHMLDLILIAA